MEPEDLELGAEPIDVERRTRSGVVVSVRLSADEADLLQAIAQSHHVTLTDVAREAIIAYIQNPEVGSSA
jgi:predicted transcriptional regulator